MSLSWGGRGGFAPESERLLAGLQQHGPWTLTHASPALRQSREFWLSAVAMNGDALLFAPDAFRQERELILQAVGERGSALQHALGGLREDLEFLLECITVDPEAVLQAPQALRGSWYFMMEAVQRGAKLSYGAASMQGNLKLMAAEEARATWGSKREDLLSTMQSATESRDLKVLSRALDDAEGILLPDSDLEGPRNMIVALDKYNELASLWQLLEVREGNTDAAVVLIKGSWLLQLSSVEGGRLPRRQDLPKEATWDPSQLQQEIQEYSKQHRHRRPPIVISVSYCWITPTHPDPEGMQLNTLAMLVKHRIKDLGDVEPAIFIDYCSVFQEGEDGEPRSPQEQSLFDESLDSVDLWYAHGKTEKWLLTSLPNRGWRACATGATTTAFADRGWTCFELALAEFLAGEPSKGSVLDIANATDKLSDDNLEWCEICRLCGVRKEPPRTPQQFASDLVSKKFSNASDSVVLEKRYSETFDSLVAYAEQLTYRNLAWGNQEASRFALTLKFCTTLQSLDFDRNLIGDQGVVEIMDALVECPTLGRLVFSTNRVGDFGAQHIAKALPKCTRLATLDLSFNIIGNAGTQAFIDMFENGAVHPALDELLLNNNDIGATSKRHLRVVATAKQGTNFKFYV